MASNRVYSACAASALCGALVLSPACAAKTAPAAAPAARAAAAPTGASRPSAPAPLLGHVTREALRAYVTWQPLFVEPYGPDADAITAIKANSSGVAVLVIVATWCPDSKREVPRFFAIMDEAGISESQVTMVGVDRTKKDAEGLTEKWGITRVPTFVFFRNGQEVGRVVERTPAGATLEGEIARVLAARL